MEQMGLSSKDGPLQPHRWNPARDRAIGRCRCSMNQFERLEQFAKLQKPPAIKFKDLEAAVASTIKYNLLPMKARADYHSR